MESIEKKIFLLKKKFAPLSKEERYLALIELGKKLAPYPSEFKNPLYEVKGCQSTLHLSFHKTDQGRVIFFADSDALISKGLAALLIDIYSEESPQTILETPPSFLIDLDILSALTPSRSNGLAHIHKRMKEIALANYR